MRAYKRKNMKGKEVDILCPLDSFKITIDGEICRLLVMLNGEGTNDPYVKFYMSGKQYNTLMVALKNPNSSTDGLIVNGAK